MSDERRADWQMRPALFSAVLLTGLGLSLALWWLGLAWFGLVALLVALARYAPWLLRTLLRL
jgi:hypothetical protein